jgi:hypothetical protein
MDLIANESRQAGDLEPPLACVTKSHFKWTYIAYVETKRFSANWFKSIVENRLLDKADCNGL